MIDETGGRGFDTARSVVRVLDSLRAYWPSLSGRVDLVDLVWLRIIAVTSPALYRWIEEYLTAYASLMAGRVVISEQQQADLTGRMDEVLAASNLLWKHMKFELERHLPGISYHEYNQSKDERLFSRAHKISHARDFEGARLASPSHSRIYFTLAEPADGVTDIDIGELLQAAAKGPDAVASLIRELAEQRGDTGATKAERLLDQLREIDGSVLEASPVEALVMGLVTVADVLAMDEAGDDWGYPRIWFGASKLLLRLSRDLEPARWSDLIQMVFTAGPSMGFISHLLRAETFSHGFYGDRPDPWDCMTTPEMFGRIRLIMLDRYSALGLDRILAAPHAVTMLYAWPQAGGRDDVVQAVGQHTADPEAFVDFMLKICTSSLSSRGANLSLSLDAIHTFFDNPPDIVRRLRTLAAETPPLPGAESVLAAIVRNVRFEGGDIERALEVWEQHAN